MRAERGGDGYGCGNESLRCVTCGAGNRGGVRGYCTLTVDTAFPEVVNA